MQKEVKDLINWRALSRILTGEDRKNPIRYNTIPKIHQEKTEKLYKYIQAWLDDRELIEKEQAEKNKKQFLNDFKSKIDQIYTNM